MKLLIVTQAVDTENPALGFFVRWIAELAKQFERIEVICLTAGKHALPENVRVHSLGKERGVSRLGYIITFYRYVWSLRGEYDAVFVHMNQEYILLAGWLWKLLGKRVYLWRNHYAGSFLTDVAALFCTKVFCTSKHSYTAKYAKTVLMPVGVDTERFMPDALVTRKERSILFLARMAPSKRPEMLLEALLVLQQQNIAFTATFVGSPLPEDGAYYETLKEKAIPLGAQVTFLPSVAHAEAPDLYRAHEIFVNASPSGMLDKTIFEAATSGCIVLAASEDWKSLTGVEYSFISYQNLSNALTSVLQFSTEDYRELRRHFELILAKNSLATLTDRIYQEVLECLNHRNL